MCLWNVLDHNNDDVDDDDGDDGDEEEDYFTTQFLCYSLVASETNFKTETVSPPSLYKWCVTVLGRSYS